MHAFSALELTDLITRARDGCAESLGTLLEMYRSYLRLIAAFEKPTIVVCAAPASVIIRYRDRRGVSEFAVAECVGCGCVSASGVDS